MTRNEAAEVLNLSPDASADDVRKKFQELYSDFQIRLSNAPTPNLKKTYQKSLEDLRTACECLYPGIAAEGQRDLPASQPVQYDRESKTQVKRTDPTPSKPLVEETRGLARSTMIAFFLAIVMAALASFFAIMWFQQRASLENVNSFLSADANEQLAILNQKKTFAPGLQKTLGAIQNGRFQVCNASSAPVKITSLTASYRTTEGRFKTFNSTAYDWKSWMIRPGSRQSLDFARGEQTTWDGSVLFYSAGITYNSQDYIFAGSWDQVKDGCLKLALD